MYSVKLTFARISSSHFKIYNGYPLNIPLGSQFQNANLLICTELLHTTPSYNSGKYSHSGY